MALLAGCALARPNLTVRVDAVPDKDGTVWMRPTGSDEPLKLVSNHVPCTIELPQDGLYELYFYGPEGLWRSTGHEAKVQPGSFPTIYTHRTLNWPLVAALGAVASLAFLSLGLWSRRRLGLRARALEQDYGVAQKRLRGLQAWGDNPTQIGDYVVKGRLGEGGMAKVYRVESPHGDEFALKVPSTGEMERFERECQILKSFHHPGVVRLVDFAAATEEHPAFLVMELIDGETLQARLDRMGLLGEAEALNIALSLLNVLDYTHSRGILHRDLTPNNVFLCPGGGVKVVDFGISKDFNAQVHLTRTEEMLGTPMYAAPEQLMSGAVTERTDLYQLGALLYRMLTGGLPWSPDLVRLIMEKGRMPAKSPAQVNGRVSRPVSDAVMRLLEPDPANRPASAREAADLLGGVRE